MAKTEHKAEDKFKERMAEVANHEEKITKRKVVVVFVCKSCACALFSACLEGSKGVAHSFMHRIATHLNECRS